MDKEHEDRLRHLGIEIVGKLQGEDDRSLALVTLEHDTLRFMVVDLQEAVTFLTAANIDLTERVLYAERERDEAREQEAAVEKERRHWYDLCGKANVRIEQLTAELARKDEVLERIADLSGAPDCTNCAGVWEITRAALEAK